MKTPLNRFMLIAAFSVAGALAGAAGAGSAAPAKSDLPVDIPYTMYTLKNGLRLVVHEDRKAPIVAVNIWYHVGSKDEKPGKTGFAHLFEHLMFNGSENYDGEWFKAIDAVGGTTVNGTTWFDRTNYFQNVPKTGLDTVLWLESDRMGHLLGAVTKEKLDNQRGVVQNEKRQGENQPYGKVDDLMLKSIYPAAHPMSWDTIGSMDDLNAASLEDVHSWFKEYYGAANTVLVIAGDISPEEAKAKVEKYFGDIPSGPTLQRHKAWVAKRSGAQRAVMHDRVPQARVYKVWNVPQWGDRDGEQLDLAAAVLGGGKNSRLFERLVYRDKIATEVFVYRQAHEISAMFTVVATVQPGGDVAAVEKAIDEELARFLKSGPTKAELEREKTQLRAAFVRGVEAIGGFGGKSAVLAESAVYGGSPDAWKQNLRWTLEATPADVKRVANAWLSDGVWTLHVLPYPNYGTEPSQVDRKALPKPDSFPAGAFPARESVTLSNGLKVVVASRNTVPVVNMTLIVDAGYAADGALPGLAGLTGNMMDEGTKTRTSLQISDELARLGATLGAGSNLDNTFVTLSALKDKLAPSLDLYAEVVLDPSFPQEDFERLRQQTIAAIKRERVTPNSMANRLFPRLIFGKDHPYGVPFSGLGYEEVVKGLTREQLAGFHAAWFKPNNATLVVAGDTTLAELLPMLEQRFGKWARGDAPKKDLREVALPSKPVVYIVDRPESQQSVIIAGHAIPPKSFARDIAFDAANEVFGGDFTSRINMNLREDKGWSYGSYAFATDARGPRPYRVFAPVQTDRTAESMAEIAKELAAIVGGKPATAEELAAAKARSTLTLPGRWETINAVLNDNVYQQRFGLADDHWPSYAAKVNALTLDEVNAVAREVIKPAAVTWVVVGDRKKIEDPIRKLNLGELRFVDADGNPVGQ
jgi:zinc protease